MLGAKLQHATFNPLESKDGEPKNASLQMVGLGDADLTNAEFRQANLTAARFQEQQQTSLPTGESMVLSSPAFLHGTDFRNANLFLANFKGCYFYGTKLEGAFIRGADIYDAHLEEADWGSYVIGEEEKGEFYFAEHGYRHLKKWYTEAGMYDIAGEFFFKEMTVKRKTFWWGGDRIKPFKELIHPFKPKELLKAIFPKKPFHWAWSQLIALICGYGEKPLRVIRWAASVILVSTFIYFLIGSIWQWSALWKSLYFSVVSFTALGYGSWVDKTWVDITNDWIRGLGAAESFIGVFTIALFLVTFIRKMTR